MILFICFITIPDWLQVLGVCGSAVGIPALLFTVWQLVRKDRNKQQQLGALFTLAEESREQTEYLGSLVEILSVNMDKTIIEDRPRLSLGKHIHGQGAFSKELINQSGSAKLIEIIDHSENISVKPYVFHNVAKGDKIKFSGIFKDEPVSPEDKFRIIFKMKSEMDKEYYQRLRIDGEWKGHITPPNEEMPNL